MLNTTLNLYPTTSSSMAEISTIDLQYQLYFNMKSKSQDQAADPELWEILRTKKWISNKRMKNQAKTDKTEHGTERAEKSKSKSTTKSTPTKSKTIAMPENKKYLMGPPNGDSFTYDSTLNYFDNPPDFSYPPPQPQYVPYSCELCGNDAHHGYDCPSQVPFVVSLAWETISKIEHAFEDKQYQPEGILELFRKLHDDVQNIHEELAEYINTPNWNRPIVYYDDDDDKDYTIAITPVLSTKEPVDSLIMEDEHLDTILAMESDEIIKSSVENLVQISSESEGIPDNMCDVPFRDNSLPLDISKFQFEGFSDSNDDSTSIDDDSFSIDDIDYVEASPLRFDPSLKWVEIIEALKDNPTPSYDFVTKSSSTSLNFFLEETNTFDNSLPESETFCFYLEEKSSDSPTSYSDLSLPDYEAFFCDSEPDSGNFTIDVVEDILIIQQRTIVHCLITKNKIFDPGIFIGVQSMRFLSLDEFSISFIRDLPFPVIDAFLPFLPQNEDKVSNPGILASNEETSPHLLSHRGFNPSKINSDFSESPMMISGGDIPILDVPFLYFYPP
ncbi:hypothetical protein Tco_0448406 [Tanacetum coccineum]